MHTTQIIMNTDETKTENTSVNSTTHNIANSGDADKIKTMLQDNPDYISSTDDKGWTPLHTAAYNGQKNLIKLLMANGAEINAIAKDGVTPIDVAAMNGHRDAVDLLFHYGGTPSKKAVFVWPVIGAIVIAALFFIEFILFDNWTNGGKGGNGSVLPWTIAFLGLISLFYKCVRNIFFLLRRKRIFKSLGIHIKET